MNKMKEEMNEIKTIKSEIIDQQPMVVDPFLMEMKIENDQRYANDGSSITVEEFTVIWNEMKEKKTERYRNAQKTYKENKKALKEWKIQFPEKWQKSISQSNLKTIKKNEIISDIPWW